MIAPLARRARAALAIGLAAIAVGGCAPTPSSCRAEELAPLSSPRLAVVLSDYASAAVAIVDEEGVVHAPWIDSGSRPPGIVAALSGDVVLPRANPVPGLLVLVDRYQTDVLTGVSIARPDELFQVDLRGGRTSGSSPNPQDVLALEDGRWLVSRYNPAEDGSAPELARGNDLAVLAPGTHALTSRVDLEADVTLDGVRYFARPYGLARMRAGGDEHVLVALSRLSSFVLRETGPGAVALLDPASGHAEVLELEGLSNCTNVAAFRGDPARAVVLCRGDAFGEDATRSGLAVLGIDGGSLTLLARLLSIDDPALPPPSNGLVALEGARFAYVSSGSFVANRLDRLVVLDVERGSARVIAESSPTPFELGDGAFDPERGELLVPDGNAGSLRRFAASDAELAPIALGAPCLTLAPRQAVLLR